MTTRLRLRLWRQYQAHLRARLDAALVENAQLRLRVKELEG